MEYRAWSLEHPSTFATASREVLGRRRGGALDVVARGRGYLAAAVLAVPAARACTYKRASACALRSIASCSGQPRRAAESRSSPAGWSGGAGRVRRVPDTSSQPPAPRWTRVPGTLAQPGRRVAVLLEGSPSAWQPGGGAACWRRWPETGGWLGLA
ncbi:hypothetical protein TARUN_10399 [Trichoderma arundinaceum]|uniref:Uncharacterized protein n=1 Tax=Trichoderma arundinaceum TaxID=490622 RepID=A0A395N7J9_TRIAR|nr:hypothetical protein TARUN_10399 [Trichoderma arundinaceum]